MTKIKNKFLAIIFLLLINLNSNLGLAQSTLTVAFQSPLNHHLAQNIIFFKDELEMISNNKISLIINDYGSYIKKFEDEEKEENEQKYFMAKDILEAVKVGKVEVGMLSLSRITDLIPIADIFNQPFIIDSEKKVADSLGKSSIVRRSIENELKKFGVTALWWQPYGNIVFISNGLPVKRPENMKNKKVRVVGTTLGNLVLASGGTPLAIPNSSQYFAYKHKKVDIGMTTISDIKTKKIWEVMDTISLANVASMQFLLFANNSWWDSINQNERQLILQAALTAEEQSVKRLKDIEVESYNKAIQNGMNIVVLSNDDRDFWREVSSPIYKNFLDKTGSNGQMLLDSINLY